MSISVNSSEDSAIKFITSDETQMRVFPRNSKTDNYLKLLMVI